MADTWSMPISFDPVPLIGQRKSDRYKQASVTIIRQLSEHDFGEAEQKFLDNNSNNTPQSTVTCPPEFVMD